MSRRDELIKSYVSDVTKEKNVAAIALTGSAGRGDYDQHSDVDVVVFLTGPSRSVKDGKFIFNELLFDVRISDLGCLKKADWSQDMFFAYLTSRVAYDRDGEIGKLIESKKSLWREKVTSLLCISLVNLSVIFEFDDNWRGLKAHTHYQKFIRRGDIKSAHQLLNRGFDLILDCVYLLNRSPIPDYKNKVRCLKGLDWLPNQLELLIEEGLLVKSFLPKDAERRHSILKKYLNEIRNQCDLNFELPSNIYRYYLDNRD